MKLGGPLDELRDLVDPLIWPADPTPVTSKVKPSAPTAKRVPRPTSALLWVLAGVLLVKAMR